MRYGWLSNISPQIILGLLSSKVYYRAGFKARGASRRPRACEKKSPSPYAMRNRRVLKNNNGYPDAFPMSPLPNNRNRAHHTTISHGL